MMSTSTRMTAKVVNAISCLLVAAAVVCAVFTSALVVTSYKSYGGERPLAAGCDVKKSSCENKSCPRPCGPYPACEC